MSEFNLAKLVPFLTFLLLWQLGFDFKSQGIAQTSKLPPDEEKAFRDFINRLELTQAPPISPSFCSSNPFVRMNTSCDCTYDGGSVCHITEIIMENLQMRGSINPAISNLKYLKRLDLSNNVLGGGIPDSVGNLSSLNYLDLGNNQLTGNIPKTLGNLKNLTLLHLGYNLLKGNIPSTLGALSSLVVLDLSTNLLTNKIPNELGNLTELESLILEENQLSGPLPEGLGRLSNLWLLLLRSNKLTGRVPESYSQLSRLQYFAIAGNYLSGSIPKFIKKWTNLYSLSTEGNNFEGPLPTEIFEMSNLMALGVSDLNNSGFPFPKSANLTNIIYLGLRNCSVNGPIPTYIGSWSSLTYIDLSFNNLSGEIPDSIKNLTLSKMDLSRNMLNGTIPAWIPKHVRRVDLSYNNFSGIPKEKKEKGISQPIRENATLYACCSTGAPNKISPFSTEKKYCPGGKSKDYSLFINCGGQGTTVDRNYYEADNSTSDFYESPNRNWAYSCSGDFLSNTANSSNYITNQRCGVSVPEAQLYAESRFCPISLTYYGFCLHKGNYSVTLHFAETVYTDDADYSNLGKRVFDVYIQGERKLTDFNIKEKAGGPNKARNETFYVSVNRDPLVIHFFWAGKGSIALNGPLVSAISVTHVRSGKLSPSHIALITVASVITPLLLLAFVWKMGWLGNGELEEKDIQLQGRSVTLKQLIHATKNFSSKKEIGRSRFAKVYEANFTNPDQRVAVKKISSQSKLAVHEIITQILAIKLLRHDNVVQLFDGYSEKDLHLLVYEYMDHKSLDRALFGGTPFLDWDTRFNICRGVAMGLKYLHEQERIEIVHRNIKASNILLDETLNAKVSDFGLARLYDDQEDQFKAIRARATHSVYMAPEYATRKIKTDKADVYSFGVVLLEIVSGKSSSKLEEKRESKFLLEEASRLHIKGRLVELVDEKLSKYDHKQVNTILSLAIMCTDPSPNLRPAMSEVLSVLQDEKSILQISKAVTPSTYFVSLFSVWFCIFAQQQKALGSPALPEVTRMHQLHAQYQQRKNKASTS